MEIRESAVIGPRLGIGSPKKPSLRAEDKVDDGLGSRRKQAAFASKEEAFFDSQGWLDSDSEDDFVSVNGDSTPFSFSTNKEFSADTFPDATSEPSSADAKGKLVDLLQQNQVRRPSPESELNGKPEFSEIDATSFLPGIPPHDETSHVATPNRRLLPTKGF
ncbi:hypothetical protein OPV22_031007 [Ensete ventricosum]|uniref:Uncharacterized protein n=1 Tax=Ensete ventricosum TaxID=4639 RepID=A0AAV8NZ10_ENSVE|nr:hypothetical protein OPV22_031007 [Ensete ventricosum]